MHGQPGQNNRQHARLPHRKEPSQCTACRLTIKNILIESVDIIYSGQSFKASNGKELMKPLRKFLMAAFYLIYMISVFHRL